ncbi:MAG TPA: hypothetical protein VMT64_06170 [Candidatus Binataceae bacterium]|nr:hypothetical protein [Candidatus Binataceae bacterium]
MSASCCSAGCGEGHDHSALEQELNRRWWIGVALVMSACAIGYFAHAISAWLWIPSALTAWFGTYQTIYSKGCASCGAPREENAEPARLNKKQRTTRLRMAHQFLAATIVFGAISAFLLPLLWPLTAITGWFAASFYVAVATRYLGCPEIGAIPSWLVGHPIATRCAPLERRDARAG